MQEAKNLTPYAVTARYPGRDKVTKIDALDAITIASKVRKVVRKALRQEGIKIKL